MRLATEPYGGDLLIVVEAARIDAAVAVRFKDEVRALCDTASGNVVLDLTQVIFLDSSGLGALVSTMKHLGPERRLDLVGLSPLVAQVFQLTRMDTVFGIHPTAADALGRPARAW